MDRGSREQQPLLNPQLACDPSYGIIGESLRPGAGAINADPSDQSDLFLSASDSNYQEISPSQRELSDGEHEPNSAFPGGDPAPNPVDRPMVPSEDEEQEEEVCKCCTSWYDWCLFLSCKLTVLGSPLRMPLHERKCLRRARTEGWRLLWSLVLPLAVGSVPLQLVWVIAQLVTSFALFGLSVANCVSNKCNGWDVTCVSVSGVWVALTLVDSIVCLVAIWFHRNKFMWKISPYITVLRIIYTAICLYIVVIGFYFSEIFVFPTYCDSQLSQAKFVFSSASLGVFVDLTMLVVAVQFIRKSYRLRNAYFVAHDQPTSKIEFFFLFHAIFDLIIHLLLLSSALYFIFAAFSDGFDCTVFSACYVGVCVHIGVYTALSIVVPAFGLCSIYFVHYFWLQKYLASVCLSVQSLLQDRDTADSLGVPDSVRERLQERFQSQRIDYELLIRSIRNFNKEVTFFRKLVHFCETPFSFIHFLILPILMTTIILFAMLITPAMPYFLVAGIIAGIMFAVLHLHVIALFFIFLLPAILISLGLFSLFFFCCPVVLLLCFLYYPRLREILPDGFCHADLVP